MSISMYIYITQPTNRQSCSYICTIHVSIVYPLGVDYLVTNGEQTLKSKLSRTF